jgi:hypothetical protein
MQAVVSQSARAIPAFSVEQENKMKIWVMCQARAPGHFLSSSYRMMFALAVLVLWVAAALADPLTLRVVEASPGYTTERRPSITIRLDDEGRHTLAQFTIEHVGEDIEFLSEGRVLMKARLRTPITGGLFIIVGIFSYDEIVHLASRLAIDGKIEVNALGRPQR